MKRVELCEIRVIIHTGLHERVRTIYNKKYTLIPSRFLEKKICGEGKKTHFIKLSLTLTKNTKTLKT